MSSIQGKYTEPVQDMSSALKARLLSASGLNLTDNDDLTNFCDEYALEIHRNVESLANLPEGDRTARDYTTILAQMKAGLLAQFPELNDTLESNNAVVLLELFSWAMYQLHIYLDARANEAFPHRARERSSVIAAARRWGYPWNTATPANVQLKFSRTSSAVQNDLIIPAGTKARTRDGVTFETCEDVTVPALSSSATVLAAQEESYQETFTGNGETNQRVQLTQVNYISGSSAVTVNAQVYSEVTSFDESTPSDRHYRVDVAADRTATLVFGNGVQGAVPANGVSVVVSYKSGGGAVGNVGSGKVTILPVSTLNDTASQPQTLTVTNESYAYGGKDEESNESILRNGPVWARTQGRCVAREDYLLFARGVVGVRRIGLLTVNENSTVSENTAAVIVLMEENVEFTTDISSAVIDRITDTYPRTLTMDAVVFEAERISVDVSVKVWILEGFSHTDVQASMTTVLNDFFNEDEGSTDFGKSIYRSVLIADLQDVPGVRNLNLVLPSDPVEPTVRQLPELGVFTYEQGM